MFISLDLVVVVGRTYYIKMFGKQNKSGSLTLPKILSPRKYNQLGTKVREKYLSPQWLSSVGNSRKSSMASMKSLKSKKGTREPRWTAQTHVPKSQLSMVELVKPQKHPPEGMESQPKQPMICLKKIVTKQKPPHRYSICTLKQKQLCQYLRTVSSSTEGLAARGI